MALALALLAGAAGLGQAAEDATSFLTGPELAAKLLHNLVTIAATDLNEQGFGLVVASVDDAAYVLTARHVVVRRPPAGLDGAERVSAQIELRFCAAPQAGAARARLVDVLDGTDDIALLRVPRPAAYRPEHRALAPAEQLAPPSPTWLLGFEQRCELAANAGAIESPRDARHKLRARHGGVRGGSSGGALLIGYGLAGLVTDSDQLIVTAHSLLHLQERLQALGLPWALVDARNIPPADPRAAAIDLAETLNQYLFAARDTQGLLLRRQFSRVTFTGYVERYNAAVSRFSAARDKYDGSLSREWPDGVLAEWAHLREQLWRVHRDSFWALNAWNAEMVKCECSPPAVLDRMQALEPELAALERAIAQFLRTLGQRRIDHANATQ